MPRALGLFVVLFLVPLVVLRAGAEAGAPITLEPINERVLMSAVSSEEIEQHFHSLSISADGAFVALGRPNARVNIWTSEGGETARLRLSWREDRRAHVVMLGDPCVAVTAVGARMDHTAPSPGAAARAIELWSCQSGERLASIPHKNEDAPNDLLDLVALPACGLVVASYTDRVTVVDVNARANAPALSKLFEEMRVIAIRSYPGTGAAGRFRVKLTLAARAPDSGCVLDAVLFEYNARVDALLPAKLYEVDLRERRSKLLRTLEYGPIVDGGRPVPTTSFATSPSGRYAALSIGRAVGLGPQVNPPRGVADLLIIDLDRGAIVRNIDMRHMAASVVDLAFVSDDALLLGMEWMAQSTPTHLLDWRSGRAHVICSAALGKAPREKGHPRAVAVNATRKLVAVSLLDEIRVFRYQLNPKGQWAKVGC